MLHDMNAREQSDAVALAVDTPKKPAFPWPFAGNTPSFTPKSIKPGPVETPTVWDFAPDRPAVPWPRWWIIGFGLLCVAGFCVAMWVR